MQSKDHPMQGERRQVTAVFVDLVSFSTIASTADAEDLEIWLEEFYRRCKEIIERHDGEVTEYLGDGVVAMFGLLIADELAAKKALHAAQEIVAGGAPAFASGQMLQIRAGIATGEVVTRSGDGTDNLPRATGMVTTLAQRIQSRAEAGSVLMSEHTGHMLRGAIGLEELPGQQLKGFAEPQTLYRPTHGIGAAQNRPPKVFVGRIKERHTINRAKKPCLIVGQAGFGKSALAEVCARDAGGATIFRADGVNIRSSYQPFRDWIYGVCGTTGPDFTALEVNFTGLDADELRSVALILGLPEGQRLLSELSNLALKSQIESSLRSAIDSSVPGRMLVFEDLHWFDGASFGVLQAIITGRADPQRRILMTSREDTKIGEYLGQLDIDIIGLPELSKEESNALLDSLAGGALTGKQRKALAKRAGGIPLFLEQLSLRGRGDAVPETLMDLLAERIDMSGAARPMIQRAAALGLNFGEDMLLAIDPDGPKPRGLLEQAATVGVLEKIGDSEWAFSHALLQQAAYQSLLKRTREALHARIARLLQGQFAERGARDPVVLAEHLSRAKEYAPAISGYLAASKWSMLQGAFADAESHIRAALPLCDEVADATERSALRIECYTALGSVLMQVRGFTAQPVQDAFDAAYQIARRREGRPEASAPALFGSFSHAIIAGDKPRSDSLCALLEEIASQAGEDAAATEFHLAALAARNCGCFYQGDFATQFEQIAKIREMYDTARHSEMIIRYGMDIFAAAQMFEPPARAICGQIDRVEDLLSETDAHQRALDIPVMQPYALIWGAVPLFYAGRSEAALERLKQGLAAADTQGAAFWQLTGQTWLHLMNPDLTATPEGAEALGQLVKMQRGIGANVGVPYFAAAHATALNRTGQTEEALSVASLACKEAHASGLLCWYAEILRMYAAICRTVGKPEEAGLALRSAIGVADRQGARLWQLRSTLDLIQTDPNAVADLGALMSAFPDGVDLPELRAARTLMAGP